MNQGPKILVGMPSLGTVRVETMTSLYYMLSSTKAQYIIYTPVSCYLHESRNDVFRHALKLDAEYVLFVDSDMVFPEDALNKLIARDKEIIGVNYNYRAYPIRAITVLDKDVPDSLTDPFPVRVAGTGFLLIKTKILKLLPEPWFHFNPSHSDGTPLTGEDPWFCNVARAHGINVWVDPTIKMGHIGTVVF
jgi:hypothetical protein